MSCISVASRETATAWLHKPIALLESRRLLSVLCRSDHDALTPMDRVVFATPPDALGVETDDGRALVLAEKTTLTMTDEDRAAAESLKASRRDGIGGVGGYERCSDCWLRAAESLQAKRAQGHHALHRTPAYWRGSHRHHHKLIEQVRVPAAAAEEGREAQPASGEPRAAAGPGGGVAAVERPHLRTPAAGAAAGARAVRGGLGASIVVSGRARRPG